jgi:3'-phosphoadenosine 5'-phosphosulfate sulfotransferase (PAPS reductase)/FAD synthetase
MGRLNVVSFSGGKDSTAMLFKMIDSGVKIDRIINIDTTMEFPEMYSHIEKVKKMIFPLEIETESFDFEYFFGEYEIKRGDRAGEFGYGWPDFRNRWCTTIKKNLFKNMILGNKHDPRKTPSYRGFSKYENKFLSYVGIAYNEKQRMKGGNYRYPLIDWKMGEKDSLEYCYSLGFDWGGLYEKFDRVSCYCCPLGRMKEFQNVIVYYPKLWEKVKKMDRKSFREFTKDYSVKELTEMFE